MYLSIYPSHLSIHLSIYPCQSVYLSSMHTPLSINKYIPTISNNCHQVLIEDDVTKCFSTEGIYTHLFLSCVGQY